MINWSNKMKIHYLMEKINQKSILQTTKITKAKKMKSIIISRMKDRKMAMTIGIHYKLIKLFKIRVMIKKMIYKYKQTGLKASRNQ